MYEMHNKYNNSSSFGRNMDIHFSIGIHIHVSTWINVDVYIIYARR